MRWHLLAGEFPPDRGGVGRHTRQLAQELSRSGCGVTVLTGREGSQTDGDVLIRGARGRWTSSGLAQLSATLDSEPHPRRILVPYAPNVFGRRGLNFEIVGWLQRRAAAGDEVHLLVHEPFYPWRLVEKPSRWVLAALQRRMMRRLLSASRRVYLSTMAWEPMLRPMAPAALPMLHLPSFSNVPVQPGDAAAQIRRGLVSGRGAVIGTFGAQPRATRELLTRAVSGLVSSTCRWVFIGEGSTDLTSSIASACPDSGPHIQATGTIDEASLSGYLQACDVMVQPYRDGITTRRTTAMACLAHGLPLVTNDGMLTEGFWRTSGAVSLSQPDAASFTHTIAALLLDSDGRRRLGGRGRALYDARFAPCHAARTISAMSRDVDNVAVG